MHSNRSDGSSTPDQIADAAAHAGLKFVVFTDHGDGTRAPDAPAYRSGVLCIDAVEISTTGGHYIALGLPRAPYPLGGEARDVVEDVRRLGGFGIVAHPDSPKEQLRWKDFTLPFDAIEALNLDTSWRQWVQRAQGSDQPARARWAAAARLLTAIVDYPFRPPETMASLTGDAGRGAALAPLIGREMLRRRIVMTAGADAHAHLSFRGDPADATYSWPLPAYEQTFRTLSTRVVLDRPFTGDAVRDASMVIAAIRAGHLYASLDGVATPPSFELTATNSAGTAHEGDRLPVAGPATIRVRSNAPAGFATTVFNGDRALSPDHHDQDFTMSVPPEPSAYWVGIHATTERGVLWLRSNPVFFLNGAPTPDAHPAPAARTVRSIFDGTTNAGWHVEHDSTSLGALDVPTGAAGPELRLRYGLSSGMTPGPFVGLVYELPAGAAPADCVTFTARAQQPMRISVQLRAAAADAGGGERWQRSVYVSTEDEARTVYFRDLIPAGVTHTIAPDLSQVRSILFVVDTTNTRAGSSGRFWIKNAALAY